eukprot:gene23811-biopygen17859
MGILSGNSVSVLGSIKIWVFSCAGQIWVFPCAFTPSIFAGNSVPKLAVVEYNHSYGTCGVSNQYRRTYSTVSKINTKPWREVLWCRRRHNTIFDDDHDDAFERAVAMAEELELGDEHIDCANFDELASDGEEAQRAAQELEQV